MPIEETDENNVGQSTSEVEAAAPALTDDVSLGKPEDLGHTRANSGIKNESFGIRKAAGEITHFISDLINENIIAARYATVATVLLLGTYGISKTPFFFRYKAVSDIPSEYFVKRKTLHGRIIRIVEKSNSSTVAAAGKSNNTTANVEKPVVCLVRHLSPVGRLLTKSAFNFSMSNSPSVRLGGRIENSRDLLKVEIAGIKAPPSYRSASARLEQPGEWLNRLSADRTPIACKLMARRVDKGNHNTNVAATAKKRGAKVDFETSNAHVNDRAICQVRYRPKMFSIFRQDLASELVGNGRASILSSGIHVDDTSTSVVDGSTDVKDLQADVKYLEKLSGDEFEAVKQYRGMWNDPIVRKERPDLVEEAEFEQTASVGKKLWRWVRERIGM